MVHMSLVGSCRCLALVLAVSYGLFQAAAAKGGALAELDLGGAAALDAQEDMQLLGLYAGNAEDCSEQLGALKRAVEEMQSVIDVSLVRLKEDEIDEAQDKYGSELAILAEDGCQVQLVLLPFGRDKEDDYLVYDGPMEGKALQTFVTDVMPDHLTPEVMPETWQAFMADGEQADEVQDDEDGEEEATMAYLSPKVLLLTNKDHVPGVLKALALRFRIISPSLGFGWIRAHDEQNKLIIDQFGPGKVPRLMLLLPVHNAESGGRMQMSAQTFQGAMRYSAMFTWLSQMASLLEGMMGGGPGKGSVEVPQLTEDVHLQQHCVAKGGGVCVMGLLDLERSGSQKLINMMGKVAGKSRDQPFYFSYLDAPRHRTILSAFSVGMSDLPTVVAFNAARKRYAVLPEKMSEPADLARFINDVLSGRVKTLPFEALPSLKTSHSARDNADTKEEGLPTEEEGPVEEEFDLSEIMNEEVEPIGSSKEERMKQIEAELQAAQEEEAAKKAGKKSKKAKKSSKSEL